MSEWISVKDKEPEGLCFVFLEEPVLGNIRIQTADYRNKNLIQIGGHFHFDMPEVIYWIPQSVLPQPPGGDHD